MRRAGILPLAIVPATLFLALMLVVPLLLLFSFGFLEIERGVVSRAITLQVYRDILGDSFYRYVFVRTFVIALGVTALCLLFGYPIAYLYARVARRWRVLILTSVFAPLLTSALARTFGWMVILGNEGAVNRALVASGLIERPVQFLSALSGVVIAMTQVLLPFMIVPLITALQSLPSALEESAANLGATRWQTFWWIVVPQSLPGIAAGVSLVFVLAFTEFTVSVLMGGGTFAVVSVYMFQAMTTLLDWSRGAAIASLLLACSTTVVTLFNLLVWRLTPWMHPGR